MKIKALVLLIAFLPLKAEVAYGKGYEVKKEVGGYIVVMKIDRNPPVAGDNNVSIEVTDAKTLCACQANVAIEYFRPAMPGMPAQRYNVNMTFKRGRHIGKISLTLPGPWNIAVKITTGDKTWTTNFVLDVE
ncbi:MAG TPA: hypothetical protein VMU21_12880 [Thermodesulfovibrionales bacterium]|nr:hypothetical protein [Thermodesulfovibrionales bacterium]